MAATKLTATSFLSQKQPSDRWLLVVGDSHAGDIWGLVATVLDKAAATGHYPSSNSGDNNNSETTTWILGKLVDV